MIIRLRTSGSIRPRECPGTVSSPGIAEAAISVVLAFFAILMIGPNRAGYAATDPRPDDAPLDIATVLQLAGQQSETAVLARAQVASAEADFDKAQAVWWPWISFGATYTVRDHPVEVAAGPFRFAMTEQSNGQYELAAREILWDGGRRGLAVTAAHRRQEAVQAAGDVDVQQTQLTALDAYLRGLELTGRRQVLEQRILALRAHFGIARDLYDQGLVARNDLLETEVSVREVEDAVQAVRHAQAIALQNLNRLLGREPEAAAILPDSLPDPPALPADREALLAAAADQNAGLKAASFKLDAEKTAARLARRAWLPNLSMTLSHAWQENEALVHPHVNSVMAGVSWSIFDGGARKADVSQADARLTAAVRTHLEARRAVSVALDGAWRDHEQARREEMTARENVAAACENLRIVEDQYRAGVARSSDVLDAETLLAESRYKVVTKHYARYFAQARLLTAAGWDLVGFYGDRRSHDSGSLTQEPSYE